MEAVRLVLNTIDSNKPSTDCVLDQFIKVHKRLSVCALQRTILGHFFCISLWQFMFFHVGLFSYCTIYMLHFFVK